MKMSSHTMRSISMPLGMVVGALLCYPINTFYLFNAILHLLSRECSRYATFVVAFVAYGGAGCDYGCGLYGTSAIG